MSRPLISPVISIAIITAAAGSAQGAFFSFASDNDHTSWTWKGGVTGATINRVLDGDDGFDPFDLMIDDNNGPRPAVSIRTEFEADITLSWINSFPLGGGLFLHTYNAVGSFSFLDPSNNNAVLLRCDIGPNRPAVFSAPGDATHWSSTGSQVGADSYADVTYTATPALIAKMISLGAAPADYGLIAGPSTGPDDFGFDLTVLNVNNILGVALGADHFPTELWRSESSYSGSANSFIPTPGAAAFLGLGGLIALRRRRN